MWSTADNKRRLNTPRSRHRMKIQMLVLAVALLVGYCPLLSSSTANDKPHKPTFDRSSGTGLILSLLDINRQLNINGSCSQLDPRALLVAHAALWSHESLIKTSVQPCSGLRIFDVCGSPTRALDILLSELKGNGCSTDVKGIITFTSTKVHSAIKVVLARLEIPQVIIWRDIQTQIYVASPFQSFIRIKSDEKAKALLELSQSMKWSYINTRVSDSEDAVEEHRSFIEMAANSRPRVCVAMAEDSCCGVHSQSSTVLFFNNGLTSSGQHTAANLSNATSRVTLFVSDSDLDLNQIVLNATTNGLLLKEDVVAIKEFSLAGLLVNKSMLMLDDGSEISRQWLVDSRFCEIKNQTLSGCNQGAMSTFMLEALNLKATHAAIRAVNMILADEIVYPEGTTEAMSNTTESSNSSVAHSTKPPGKVVPRPPLEHHVFHSSVFKLTNTSGVWEPNTTYSLFATIGPVFEKVGVINGSFHPLDKTRWRLIAEKLEGSHCRDYCPACIQCPYNTTLRPIESFEEGDLYIALVLPVRKSLICDGSFEDNEILTTYFLNSIQELKQKQLKDNTGVTLGGIVIDSCQSQKQSDNDFENNCYSLIDKKNITRVVSFGNIISYIHIPDLPTVSSIEKTSSRFVIPNIHITKIGSFLDHVHIDRYAYIILEVLESLRWSYLTILYSEDTVMDKLQQLLVKKAKLKNMCIRDHIRIVELKEAQLLDGHHVFLQKDSSAVILLTNPLDTADFLHSISMGYNSSHIFNIVFFPWNSEMFSELGTNLFQSSILIEINDPKSHEIPNNITSLTVTDLESQLGMCHLSPSGIIYCPTGSIIKKTTKSVLANYVSAFLQSIAHSLENIHSKLCPGVDGLCKAFHDWPRVTSQLRHSLQNLPVPLFSNSRRFDNSGTLNVNLAVKNLQRIKGEFEWVQVGEFTVNNSLSLYPKSVRGYNALQDVMTPASECKGWCPYCYQCDSAPGKTLNEDNDVLYIPGDILITAVMPVRRTGRIPFECGQVTVDNNVDQLVESLIYAVKTAKQRHVGLLDGVNPGLLIFDSCSSKEKAMTIMGNFESCSILIRQQRTTRQKRGAPMKTDDHYRVWGASPKLAPAYITVGGSNVLDTLSNSVADFGKPMLVIEQEGETRRAERDSDLADTTLSLGLAAKIRISAMVGLMHEYQWSHIFVVASDSIENRRLVKLFNNMARNANICILHVIWLNDMNEVGNGDDKANNETKEDDPFVCALKHLGTDNTTKVVVAFITEEHFVKLDLRIKDNGLSIIWIFDQSDRGWEIDPASSSVPIGSFTISRLTQVYRGFQDYYSGLTKDRGNIWFNEQWQQRFLCDLHNDTAHFRGVCTGNETLRDEKISPVTTDVIRAADAILFALQTKYTAICGGKGGLCRKFALQNPSLDMSSFGKEVKFENDTFKFDPSREIITGVAIYNRYRKENGTGIMKVAEWKNDVLSMIAGKSIKLYDCFGEEMDENDVMLMMAASCTGNKCSCLNIPTKPTPTVKSLNSSTMALTLRREGYTKSSGEFTGTIWATVVMTVAAAGVLTAICIFFYLLYKYCMGTGCGRRYSMLAMFLLFAIIIQYGTILPFVFSPNELICEMRYFAPGFGYSFTLSIMLVKLMNLHDYRLVGLGGTLSNINQLFTVLFITGVQIAIGVQRWLLKSSALIKVVTYYGLTMYGCAFNKLEFVFYTCYPMFLQLLCLFYSIGLYKEKRNLREAKYILIACMLSVLVWVAWQLVYFLRPDDLMQPAVAVAILTFTSINLAVIFIPKIHMMATLKYDVNKTSQDHYSTKADSDFFFERPFSLPGTMKTSVSDKTYSRSYAAFENFDHSSGSV